MEGKTVICTQYMSVWACFQVNETSLTLKHGVRASGCYCRELKPGFHIWNRGMIYQTM